MKKKIAIITFLIVLALGMVFGIAIPLRRDRSDIEQRYLAKFPTPNMENVLDGSFFADVSLWYADSYPGREQMLTAERKIQEIRIKQQNQIN